MLRHLRTTAEFERVKKEGGYWMGRCCSLNAAHRPAETAERGQEAVRVGYITSKKIGNAVKRNRARRLMRESIHALAHRIDTGWDIVLIARPAMAAPRLRMQVVRDELEQLLQKAALIKSG